MQFKALALRVLIEGVAKLLTNDQIWKTAQGLVEDLWDMDISGEEKAKRVKEKLKVIGGITSKSLLNILNELAYLYVKVLKGAL